LLFFIGLSSTENPARKVHFHPVYRAGELTDPRLADMMQPGAMPFDGKRMFWGGFKVAVRL
jgi:uncharacterized protein YbaA (DUF1428 family)